MRRADCRFLSIPLRPEGTEGWSEEKLQALVTRDSIIGVGIPACCHASCCLAYHPAAHACSYWSASAVVAPAAHRQTTGADQCSTSLTSTSCMPVRGWHRWLVPNVGSGMLVACNLAAVMAHSDAHLWPLQTRTACSGGTAQDPRSAGEGWGQVLPRKRWIHGQVHLPISGFQPLAISECGKSQPACCAQQGLLQI